MSHSEKKIGSSWRKLDNAAKVFPATATKKNTKVFRFYCELNEPIIQENLQMAMEETLNKYPLFKSVLRKGLFWFYLENREYTPSIKEEVKSPCSELYSVDSNKYLFRINYYKNRINFEVFHVLTDGTGATEFLKELVINYLYITHKKEGLEKLDLIEEVTVLDHEDDSFTKYYRKDIGKRKKKYRSAHQLSKFHEKQDPLQVYEGIVSTQEILKKSKEYGVSITVYLTAVFLCAINQEVALRYKRKPIVLMIPVNLRNFFPSKSMLNFFGYIDPSYKFNKDGDVDMKDVITEVNSYFNEELTTENMAKRMNEYTRLEKHPILRFAPLDIKNWGIYLGAIAATSDITAIFSNMSIVKVEPSYEKYIKQFGVFTSTPKLELCMCSFKERMVLNFTSYYNSTNIKRNFFNILKHEGITVEESVDQFPTQKEVKNIQYNFLNWLNFTSICLLVVASMINILVLQSLIYFMISSGAVASMWVCLSIGYKKRSNLLKNALIQLIIIILGSLIWDYSWTSTFSWSLNMVLPLSTIMMLVFMVSISKLQKLNTVHYMIYLVSTSVIGMVPVILVACNLINFPLLSVLCTGISIVILTYLFIFKKYEFITELNKNLHI